MKDEKIIAIREKSNLSQKEFAAKVGVSRQQVIRWEKGDCCISQRNIERVCDAFSLSKDFFSSAGIENTFESIINSALSVSEKVIVCLIVTDSNKEG